MEIRDKPATPVPSRLLGALLLVCGGLFIGDFVYGIATYSPTITAAPLTVWVTFIAGTSAGAVLVGIGVAAVLQSEGRIGLTDRSRQNH